MRSLPQNEAGSSSLTVVTRDSFSPNGVVNLQWARCSLFSEVDCISLLLFMIREMPQAKTKECKFPYPGASLTTTLTRLGQVSSAEN